MDKRTQELIDFTREKFGLRDYYLERYSFSRSVNVFNETKYSFSMEWFPNEIADSVDEDENPDGTAVVEIDIHSRKYQSVIFVMGQTFATDGISFGDKNDIIRWIEQETGLTHHQHFQLWKEVEGELHFRECINGVPVSPSGSIEIHYNHDGKLTFFTVHGHFPSKEMIAVEHYTLELVKVGDIAREQLKLLEFPLFEKEQIVKAYAVEELYIRNDLSSTIPFEIFADVRGYVKINNILYWDKPPKTIPPLDRKEITWQEEVTAEQAFSEEPSPDSFPLTQAEQEKCVGAVQEFLCQEYPNDSGVWNLKTLHRETGYIHATLRADKQDSRVFQRKMNVMIDAKSFQVVNNMDNQMMLEMFDDFQASEEVTIIREEAFEKLIGKYELTPMYVYDFDQKQYVQCGKIDCQFAVHATTGEIVPLDEL